MKFAPELVSIETGVVNEAALLADLRGLIQSARQRVARVANSTHTMLCWYVGQRLLKENLQDGRGAYGKQILATVAQQLVADFGEGYSYSSLTRMVRFAENMTDQAIEHAREQTARLSLPEGKIS
jgi:hypothetical protein